MPNRATWLDAAPKAVPCSHDERWAKSLAVSKQPFVARAQAQSAMPHATARVAKRMTAIDCATPGERHYSHFGHEMACSRAYMTVFLDEFL